MTLVDLEIGRSGVIAAINGDRVQRVKLLDMGLTPGTLVHVEKRAPMGDPIEIKVRSYMITLRKDEAALIEIGHSDD